MVKPLIGARIDIKGRKVSVPQAIALEKRLRRCRNVRTLGVRSNFRDYTAEERQTILKAPKIYYPSVFYADLLDAMGKALFPSYHTYKCVQDKIKQTALFDLLGVPHPRTRVYYGKRQMARIPSDFSFPLVAKVARGSALGKGVFLIHTRMNWRPIAARPAPLIFRNTCPSTATSAWWSSAVAPCTPTGA